MSGPWQACHKDSDSNRGTQRWCAKANGYRHEQRGFQTQPYIGYGDVARYGTDASWQQPQLNNVAIADQRYPPVKGLTVPTAPALGVAIDRN